MKLLSRTLPLSAIFSASAVLAHAHPGHAGHDGGEFTWDFSHLGANPLATFGYLTVLFVVVMAVRSHQRSRRSGSVQSARTSTDGR